MNTKFPFNHDQISNIVYVKRVAIDDLPEDIRAEVRAQADGADALYAVHREDGEQLALVMNRELAYMLARENDLSPVSIH